MSDDKTAKTSPTVGCCYLVGAGPGDLGLTTLRAKELISSAEVLVYDYLANPEMLTWAPPEAEIIYAGKKAGDHALTQDQTNALLIERALAGKKVVRLKGGDPFVYGRGGEEAEQLVEAGVPFEIVPGISSTIAGPAYAGIPVTHRDFNTHLTFFTGHEDPTKAESNLDYDSLAKAPGTKIMLMGIERMRPITDKLIAHGADPSTPVCLIRWATTPRQGVLTGTLGTIADEIERTQFKAPAVAVIGHVTTLRDKLAWFDRRPLFGQRVVVTRTRAQAGSLTQKLRDLGADVIELPTIRIEPTPNLREFAELAMASHSYEWLIFTSPNGVDHFFTTFFKLYKDVRSIGGCRIAAIGPGTAAKVREYRLDVDLIAQESTGEGLLAELLECDGSVENRMFLLVRPEGARDVIATGLIDAGAIVDEAIAYRTVAETSDPTGAQARFRDEGAHVLTFASSSAVDHFVALGLPIPPETKIASIGPITTQALRKHRLRCDLEADTHDIPGLLDAVVSLCQK
jgi:uroporphyrinogen III methyltransferase / synthase